MPMDPGAPKSRLAYMLSQTAAPVVLTQSDMIEHLPDYAQIKESFVAHHANDNSEVEDDKSKTSGPPKEFKAVILDKSWDLLGRGVFLLFFLSFFLLLVLRLLLLPPLLLLLVLLLFFFFFFVVCVFFPALSVSVCVIIVRICT